MRQQTSVEVLPNELEGLKLQISVHMEEYKALRAEIVGHLACAQQILNTGFYLGGALLAAWPWVEKLNRPYILGLFPLVFHAILWSQLRYIFIVLNISNHISKVIATSVANALQRIAGESVQNILVWEDMGRDTNHPKIGLFMPVEGSRYMLPYFAAAATFASYLACIRLDQLNKIDACLIIMNILLLGYSALVVLRGRTHIKRRMRAHNVL